MSAAPPAAERTRHHRGASKKPARSSACAAAQLVGDSRFAGQLRTRKLWRLYDKKSKARDIRHVWATTTAAEARLILIGQPGEFEKFPTRSGMRWNSAVKAPPKK